MTKRDDIEFVDYFDLLGVSESADRETLARAFRRKAKETHPDASKREEYEEFALLQDAYEVLADEKQRRRHINERKVEYGRRALIGLKPIVRDVFDDIVEYAKDLGGYRRKNEYELRLKRLSKSRDKRIVLAIPVSRICRKCKGIGSTLLSRCSECGGNGTMTTTETVEIDVGAETAEGSEVRVELDSHKIILRVVYE